MHSPKTSILQMAVNLHTASLAKKGDCLKQNFLLHLWFPEKFLHKFCTDFLHLWLFVRIFWPPRFLDRGMVVVLSHLFTEFPAKSHFRLSEQTRKNKLPYCTFKIIIRYIFYFRINSQTFKILQTRIRHIRGRTKGLTKAITHSALR